MQSFSFVVLLVVFGDIEKMENEMDDEMNSHCTGEWQSVQPWYMQLGG